LLGIKVPHVGDGFNMNGNVVQTFFPINNWCARKEVLAKAADTIFSGEEKSDETKDFCTSSLRLRSWSPKHSTTSLRTSN